MFFIIKLENSTILHDELMVDRNTQGSARNRFDLLRGEAENLDIQTRQLTDALETLVRIQARYIYNCIFMTKTTHNIHHIYATHISVKK